MSSGIGGEAWAEWMDAPVVDYRSRVIDEIPELAPEGEEPLRVGLIEGMVRGVRVAGPVPLSMLDDVPVAEAVLRRWAYDHHRVIEQPTEPSTDGE